MSGNNTAKRKRKPRQPTKAETELAHAIAQAKRAVVIDDCNSDDWRNAIFALLYALGQGDPPACNCVEEHSWYGDEHCSACPCYEWEHATP